MRRAVLTCGLALVAGLAAPVAPPTLAATGSADWNQFGGNAGETWSNDAVTAISPSNAATLHLVWSHRFHLREVLSPAVVGGSVYTVLCCHRDYCSSNRLVRIPIDPADARWKYGFDYTTIVGAPSVGKGVVIVYDRGCSQSDPTGYTALHIRNGRLGWGASAWAAGFGSTLNRGRELIVDGLGVNGDQPFTLVAYEASTGSVDWVYGPFPVDHWLFQPRAAAGSVYVAEGSHPSSITALSASDGSLRWNAPGLVPIAATPDVVYGSAQSGFGSASTGIVALNPADGSVLWSRSGVDPYPRAAFSSGLDVVTSPDGLVGIDPSDGSALWTVGGTGFGQPTIANGVVYARTETSNAILVLDGSTGAQLTTIPGDGAAVVADGWVFTTTDHYLNAFAP